VILHTPIMEAMQEPQSPPVKTLPLEVPVQTPIQPQIQSGTSPAQAARRVQPSGLATVELGWRQRLDWRLAGGAALLVAGAVIIVAWAWQNLVSGPSVQRVAATSSPVTSPPPSPAQSQPPAPLPQTQQAPAVAKSPAPTPAPTGQHVTLQASELTWVSTRDAAGNQMVARVFQKGDTQRLDLPNGATVRVGNAGGLSILLNGASIGSLGNHGQVREVVFRNGAYKVIAAD
jgi:hypothetical protein